MKLHLLLPSALLLGALAPVARAETISNFTSVLTTTSSLTELARPFRSGTPQDWLGDEIYSGTNNATITFYYQTYTFASSLFAGAPYVQVSFFDQLNSPSLFVTAYAGSYNVASRGTNWLGDEGSSGNYFGVDPTYFQVVLPTGSNLVLVVNNTFSNATLNGLNDPFNVTVEAFADTNFTDPVPAAVTPEPATIIEVGTGILGLAGAFRRRVFARR